MISRNCNARESITYVRKGPYIPVNEDRDVIAAFSSEQNALVPLAHKKHKKEKSP